MSRSVIMILAGLISGAIIIFAAFSNNQGVIFMGSSLRMLKKLKKAKAEYLETKRYICPKSSGEKVFAITFIVILGVLLVLSVVVYLITAKLQVFLSVFMIALAGVLIRYRVQSRDNKEVYLEDGSLVVKSFDQPSSLVKYLLADLVEMKFYIRYRSTYVGGRPARSVGVSLFHTSGQEIDIPLSLYGQSEVEVLIILADRIKNGNLDQIDYMTPEDIALARETYYQKANIGLDIKKILIIIIVLIFSAIFIGLVKNN